MINLRQQVFVCSVCEKQKEVKPDKRGSYRAPRGWKTKGDSVHCNVCWAAAFATRTLSLSVAKPLDMDWRELRDRLRTGWRDSTALYNWFMRELYVNDVRREPTSTAKKMPKYPGPDLYQQAVKAFPQLPGSMISSVQKAVKAKYIKERYEIVWTGARSLASFRYPTPIYVRADAWKVHFPKDGAPVVEFAFRSGRTDNRIAVVMRCDSRNRRHIAGLKSIADEVAKKQNLLITRGGKDNRDIMIRFVAAFPIERKIREGTLAITTTSDCLLFSTCSGRLSDPWYITGDQAKRWIAERKRAKIRFAQDIKDDRRTNRKKNRSMINASERRSAKFDRRMRTFLQQSAAQVVAFAERMSVAKVRYDDTVRSYMGRDFQWVQFRTMIELALKQKGIAFERAAETTLEVNAQDEEVFGDYAAVYVISDGDNFKIGLTGDASKVGDRLSALQTGNANALSVVFARMIAKDDVQIEEARIHEVLRDHKTGGGDEWFAGVGTVKRWIDSYRQDAAKTNTLIMDASGDVATKSR